MKAVNFQDDIFSIPNDNFTDRYVLLFDLTSKQGATENCHYQELVGEPIKREQFFFIENVTGLI